MATINSKSNNTTTAIVVGIVVALFIGLIFVFSGGDGDKFDWSTQYNEKGKQPFDLAIFYRLFTESYSLNITKERVTRELPNDASAIGSIYCFIGNEPKYTEEEAEHLMRFAENGGTVFISSENLPDSLMQFLVFRSDCGFDNVDNQAVWTRHSQGISAQFTHPSLVSSSPYRLTLPENLSGMSAWQAQNWSFFPLANICGEGNSVPIALLGTVTFDKSNLNNNNNGIVNNANSSNTEANFIRFTTKKGFIYIHTSPRFFSNYYMQTEEGLEYANKVLAHFNANKIYWDRVSVVLPKKKNQPAAQRPVPRNPMEYVYAQPALRSAWYILLGATLLYMFFRAKRRQRVIPIIEPNRNTSLEFIKTIGTLYFQQQNHRNIFQKLMQHFLAHLRQRYHIVASTDFTPQFIQRVAYRTDIPIEIISAIFDRYDQINVQFKNKYTELSVSALNDFYVLIQRFHETEAKNVFDEEKRRNINARLVRK
jgi:hypothetical protein